MTDPTRRQFLHATAATAAAATFTGGVRAAGSDILRLGLIGCGGRGTGAVVQALKADPNTKLVAMGDAFPDELENHLNRLTSDKEISKRVDVPKERRFVGFDAYQQVIDAGVDVVLLAAPPHFRPLHLAAAVAAGKHVFAEKPIAVDGPGVRKVLVACEQAKEKNLNVVSGLCWRYESFARAAMAKVHDGAVGDVLTIHSSYIASMPGKRWPMDRKPDWSDMEYQLRNWYWWTWLSGDHIVEQAVHSIDKGAWAIHDRPAKSAVGMGGLQSRKADPEKLVKYQVADPGQIFDHHAVVYEYSDGVKHFHLCRQVTGGSRDISTFVHGTKGVCHVEKGIVTDHAGKVVWKYAGPKNVMHQQEHDDLFAALRAGKTINDGQFMCYSTLLAILGRMTTYTGQVVKWEQALNSKEDLSPPRYEWGSLPTPAIAVPGKTKVV